MLDIHFVSLFPEMMLAAQRTSILQRAEEKQLVKWNAVNPRDFCYERHAKVDDAPYGGEAGMLIRPEPVALALEYTGIHRDHPRHAIIVTDPAGKRFSQEDAIALAHMDQIAILCGHYEGFDHRVVTELSSHQFSIGDFVLTGGELPALIMADAIARQIPGVLGNENSLSSDSFSDGLLSAPNYTRPATWRGVTVPDELLSGDHAKIASWRRKVALQSTRQNRPDLLAKVRLEKSDLDMLSS